MSSMSSIAQALPQADSPRGVHKKESQDPPIVRHRRLPLSCLACAAREVTAAVRFIRKRLELAGCVIGRTRWGSGTRPSGISEADLPWRRIPRDSAAWPNILKSFAISSRPWWRPAASRAIKPGRRSEDQDSNGSATPGLGRP
jgi:hypothetical protein